jgi:hypothetical protein
MSAGSKGLFVPVNLELTFLFPLPTAVTLAKDLSQTAQQGKLTEKEGGGWWE